MGDHYHATNSQIEGSTLHGGQHWSTTYNYHGDGSQGRDDRQLRYDKILRSIEPQTEKSMFLGLLPMTNQAEHISKIAAIHRNDPKLYWIFQDVDFKDWESADSPQVLWLFGPSDRGMTDVSLHLARERTSRTEEGLVFYFFCSDMERESTVPTTFTHSFLRHILNCSRDYQAKSITTTFLGSLLHKILYREPSRFQKEDPPGTTVKKILNASNGELLEALTEAVFDIKDIHEASIIIDGIDKLGKEGANFLKTFCVHMMKTARKFKVLLTCSPDPDMRRKIDDMPYIEYDKERKDCLHSLHFDDTRYDKISKEHSGSLEWLWGHEKYQAWSASKHSSLLYIEGKPGSGKSTLTKYFHKYLAKKDPNTSSRIIVHYFYTDRGTQLERTHENMLRTILSGILEQDETAFYHFQARFRETRRRKDRNWSYDSLKEVLSSFTNYPATQQLCLILDAMDESEESDRRAIIKLLCQLCSEGNACNIKVFLASRPVTELRHRIQEHHHVITLQEENKQDIYKLANDFLKLELKLSDGILDQATKYISTHAQGVFVWVDLVQKELLDYVEKGGNIVGILHVLKDIPYEELNDFYNIMLNRMVARRDIQDTVKIFRFVLFARRPLTVIELYNTLAIPEDSVPRFLPCDEAFQRDTTEMEKKIAHCGGNFLETKGLKDKTVQVMHQTVREFFLHSKHNEVHSQFMMSGPKGQKAAHITITTTCIRYLEFCFLNPSIQDNFPTIDTWASKDFEAYVNYLDQWPFINYTLENLKEHLDGCDQEIDTSLLVSTLIKQLTNNPSSRFLGNWIASHLGQTDLIYTDKMIDSDFGNRRFTHVEPTDPTDSTSTHRMTYRTRPSCGEAEVEFKYGTLNAAAKIGLSRVISALLLTCDSQRETFLLISAGKGHEATVRLLLDLGVDKEAQDNSGQRALHHAVKNGHETIAKSLLQKGADGTVKDRQGRTPLRLAILKSPLDNCGRRIYDIKDHLLMGDQRKHGDIVYLDDHDDEYYPHLDYHLLPLLRYDENYDPLDHDDRLPNLVRVVYTTKRL